ncbi:Superoxide dismutase [Cu-Zn] [Gossypium arboreum]|uniref:Superoxide dismutase [Cu-Zn] n=1 Tax=Gossypium arboreum TaxID=29729 RepID=A0A0B0NZP9_GOSAR|nr:Superoxide dismutase [Cu-Zn] [Gossypium arboreum]
MKEEKKQDVRASSAPLRGRPQKNPESGASSKGVTRDAMARSKGKAPMRTYAIYAREEAESPDVITGEHKRAKEIRNGPKMEKIGQNTESTRPEAPHTGRPYGRVNLAGSNTA